MLHFLRDGATVLSVVLYMSSCQCDDSWLVVVRYGHSPQPARLVHCTAWCTMYRLVHCSPWCAAVLGALYCWVHCTAWCAALPGALHCRVHHIPLDYLICLIWRNILCCLAVPLGVLVVR